METTITIPDKIVPKIKEAAKKKGYKSAEDFILRIIEEKLFELSGQSMIEEITDRVRKGLNRKGISEEVMIKDFEQFREKLKNA
ncbi:MAG: hypothetical protein IIA88_04635 [Bacteroidetes bacterium]|nr:hypothetical protein [Bacteroidota bacterium]